LESLEELSMCFRRSVRLRRGFVNLERAPFGGEKLRIPSLLFVEKMRTQSRFNVRVVFRCGLY
jgi:hypothetical protein